MQAMTLKMAKEVQATMAKVERISTDHADKLLALLDKAPQEALQWLYDNRVKFCWMPAARRLREKFGVEV